MRKTGKRHLEITYVVSCLNSFSIFATVSFSSLGNAALIVPFLVPLFLAALAIHAQQIFHEILGHPAENFDSRYKTKTACFNHLENVGNFPRFVVVH